MLSEWKGAIVFTGNRAFFVPAGFTYKGNVMTDVASIEREKPRTAADEYDEVSLKLARLKSITVLIRAANSGRIEPEEFPGVGYTLEHMVEDIAEHVDELFRLGGAK